MRLKYPFKSFLIILLTVTAFGQIQAQDYDFYLGSRPYQELSDAVLISSDLALGDYREKFNGNVGLNFDFKLFGKEVDTDSVIVGRQGYVLVVTKDNNHIMALDPFVAEDITKFDATSSLSHKIETVNGLRYYVVQWKNIHTTDAPGKFINLQMWVEEGGENVMFHFGPTNIPPGTVSPSEIQSGLFQLSPTFSLEKFNLLKGNASSPIFSTSNYGKMNTFPESDMTYTFATGNPMSINDNKVQITDKLFPNPVTEELNLVVADTKIGYPISIKSVDGREVYVGEISTSNTQINLNQHPKGLYIVSIGAGVNQEIHKVIKR